MADRFASAGQCLSFYVKEATRFFSTVLCSASRRLLNELLFALNIYHGIGMPHLRDVAVQLRHRKKEYTITLFLSSSLYVALFLSFHQICLFLSLYLYISIST